MPKAQHSELLVGGKDLSVTLQRGRVSLKPVLHLSVLSLTLREITSPTTVVLLGAMVTQEPLIIS